MSWSSKWIPHSPRLLYLTLLTWWTTIPTLFLGQMFRAFFHDQSSIAVQTSSRFFFDSPAQLPSPSFVTLIRLCHVNRLPVMDSSMIELVGLRLQWIECLVCWPNGDPMQVYSTLPSTNEWLNREEPMYAMDEDGNVITRHWKWMDGCSRLNGMYLLIEFKYLINLR